MNKRKAVGTILETCRHGDIERLKVSLAAAADVNEHDSKGRTAAHIATSQGRDDMLQVLIDAGIDVTTVDHSGHTPLHCCGHVDTLRLLVEYGADAFAKNSRGDTPLQLMQRAGVSPDVIRLMKQYQQDTAVGDANDVSTSIPLLSRRAPSSLSHANLVRSLLQEFYMDIGACRLICVLTIVLCASLYVAYVVTGLATLIDTRIPLTGSKTVEL